VHRINNTKDRLTIAIPERAPKGTQVLQFGKQTAKKKLCSRVVWKGTTRGINSELTHMTSKVLILLQSTKYILGTLSEQSDTLVTLPKTH
jgi:hypothetical protein